MLDLPLLRGSAVTQLFADVPRNLERYRSGDFHFLLDDPAQFIESGCEIDEEKLLTVDCAPGDDNEVQCCLSMDAALSGITPYLARDERLWARLSHLELLPYGRSRWPIPADNEKAVAHIRKHFFARGSRGIERDNVAARLWWMAAVCKKVEGLSLEQALTALLFQSDVRANIIERPSTSQNAHLLSALIRELYDSYKGDRTLFEREKFRSLMKRLNLEGGVLLLDVLDDDSLQELVTASVA